jgi:hypothetical protein
MLMVLWMEDISAGRVEWCEVWMGARPVVGIDIQFYCKIEVGEKNPEGSEAAQRNLLCRSIS